MIKLAVSGCCGKMGRRILVLAGRDSEFELAGAIEAKGHPAIGQKLSQALALPGVDVQVTDNPEIVERADVLIEFTNPATTVNHLDFALRYKKTMVIGTTGLDASQVQEIKRAGSQIAVVFSPNMSLGVNLMFRLVKEAGQQLSQNYKVDIIETHHEQKKDMPSGTAKRLVELIKQSPGRKDEQIQIKSFREGEVVGDHQVRFNSLEDTIIIKHSAKTRDIFAQGALQAAKFVVRQNPGFYDMQDVISQEGK